jgi:hypothetical protein
MLLTVEYTIANELRFVMSFSILFNDSSDCIPLKSSFELRIDEVLFSTGLNEADASYTLCEKWL